MHFEWNNLPGRAIIARSKKGIHMKKRLFLICALASTALAAELPYAGKWKVNLAKSDFGQTTVTYESLPGGEWKTTAFDQCNGPPAFQA